MVAPLTDAEQEKLPRTPGAAFPKGSFLRCQCGHTGSVPSVSSHRSHAGQTADRPPLCSKPPDVFLTLEDAQQYEAELSADQRQARRAEEDAWRRQWFNEHPEAANPPPRRHVGRPRKEESDGVTRQPRAETPSSAGTDRVEVPRRLTTRITIDLPVDAAERCDRVRLDPEYGFSGDIGDYLYQVEVSFWKLIDWLADGQQTPLAALLAA